MRGPAVFVIFCLCATGLTTTGSFTAPTARLANLLPKAGAAFGEKWLAGQNATEDPAFFHVTDVSASEFRAQIAKALQAEWKQLPDGTWELIRTPEYLRARTRLSEERRVTQIKDALETSEQQIRNRFAGTGDINPAAMLLFEAAWSLPADKLAEMKRGDILEFSTAPNNLQERLRLSPRPNWPLIRSGLVNAFGNDNSPVAEFVRNASWENPEVLARVSYSSAGAQLEITTVLSLNGRIVSSYEQIIPLTRLTNTPAFNTTNPTPLPDLAPSPYIDFVYSRGAPLPNALMRSPLATSYPLHSLSGFVRTNIVRPISERLKPYFDEPENNEIAGLPFETGLITLARATDRDIVASFQDISFYLATAVYSAGYPTTVAEFVAWAATCGVLLREESNWIYTPAGNPATLADLRVNRAALKNLLRDLQSGTLTLSQRQLFFNKSDLRQEGYLTHAVVSAIDELEASTILAAGSDRWSSHRLAAAIGLPQEAPLNGPIPINLATGPATLRSAFQNYLLVNKPTLGITESDTSPALTSSVIATEWIAEPLPADATLFLFRTTDTDLNYRVTFKDPPGTTIQGLHAIAVLLLGIPGFESPSPVSVDAITPISTVSGILVLRVGDTNYSLGTISPEYRPQSTVSASEFLRNNRPALERIVANLAEARRRSTPPDQPNQPPN